MKLWDVVVIGAGAAGLLAASRAAERGLQVLLLEKNRKPGVKILMSGGTRCNLTQATDRKGIVRAFGDQGSFLHSALAALGPAELVDLIEAEGVPTKVEPTGKIFPASDKANDVLQGLLRRLQRSGCHLALGQSVSRLEMCPSGWSITTATETHLTRQVILTTGGRSYPGCGTAGDGYLWAKQAGHTILPQRPALVPVTLQEPWLEVMKGLTVPDVRLQVRDAHGETLDSRRGSFLFTHWGCSGPAVLDISRVISGHPHPRQLQLVCDFLPDIPAGSLDDRLRAGLTAMGKRHLAAFAIDPLPRRLCDLLLAVAEVDPQRRAAEVSKADRQRLAGLLKNLPLRVTGTLGFEKAEVTAGGVCRTEVDSRSMHSKVAAGLYLAGEVLDLDGPIGGFNFQAAFSTGWLAGSSVG